MLYYGLDYQHKFDMECFYGGFQIALEYQRSFNSDNLARGMFGGTVLNFAGSQVATATTNALLADNFGLPSNFVGSLFLKPVISDFNMHLDWYFGFDRLAPGLYLQLDMNYDYQTRQLQADCGCQLNYTTSTVLFPAGYMSATTAPVYPILDLQTALGLQQPFGDKNNPTTYGRWDFCARTKNGLAGLSVNLGYDFVRCDDYFLGAFFRVVAPTGSRVNPCYVFDPIVGNGKGWELGGGISSRWELWNDNDCRSLTAMLDGYCTSVLKHSSLRTFDLASTNTALARNYLCANGNNNSCNNNSCGLNSCTSNCNTTASTSCNASVASVASCNLTNCATSNTSCNTGCNNSCTGCSGCNAQNCLTRYSLLKEFTVNNGVYTYANNLITAADFTTRNVDVTIPVTGDATVRLVYTQGGFSFGFGYNVFGMTSEKIAAVSSQSLCSTNTSSVYGVKGCQCVAYNSYVALDTGDSLLTVSAATSIPLQSTVSNATAYVSGACATACAAPDNAQLVPTLSQSVPTSQTLPYTNFNAACSSPIYQEGTALSPLPGGYAQPVNSEPPVVLTGSVNELDLCSGTAPRQFSNKGFVSFDYAWIDNAWEPYVGFFGEVEGGQHILDVAQWGVVIRGGFTY